MFSGPLTDDDINYVSSVNNNFNNGEENVLGASSVPFQEPQERYSLMENYHNNMQPNYGKSGPYFPNLDTNEQFDLLSGIYGTAYSKPKDTPVNDNPYVFIPQTVNNQLDYPRETMEEIAKGSMYLRNNTKPFETMLVGNANDPLLFKPLPKVSGQLYVNPKTELQYNSVTPGQNVTENLPMMSAVAKNRVPTTFNNPAPNGFTTTGAVVCPTVRSEINNVPQARSETQFNDYYVAGNTFNEQTSDEVGPMRETRQPFTNVEYFAGADTFNGTAMSENKDIIHTVKTQLEKDQLDIGKRQGNVEPFNSQTQAMRNKENYIVKTQLEKDQLDIGKRQGNVGPFNSQTQAMRNKENYIVKTQLEKDQLAVGKRQGNVGPFNNQAQAMRNKENYIVKTQLEKDQLAAGQRQGNVGPFNNQTQAMRNKENYTVKTQLEKDQLSAGQRQGNIGPFNNQAQAMRNKENYIVKTQLEKDQLSAGKRQGNIGPFNNQAQAMRNKENYTVKTQLEKDQIATGKRQGNIGPFNNQAQHIRNKENYTVKTQLEKDQIATGKRQGNVGPFNNQAQAMRNKENYIVKTQLEKDQITAGKITGAADPVNSVPQRVRNFLATTINTIKESLGIEHYNSAGAYNGQPLKVSDNIQVTLINKERNAPKRMGGVNDRFYGHINVKSDRNNVKTRQPEDESEYNIRVAEESVSVVTKNNERLEARHRMRNTDSISLAIDQRLDPGIIKPLVNNPYVTAGLSIF